MAILSILGVYVGICLFGAAPAGMHPMTVVSLLLIASSFVTFVVSMSKKQVAKFEPFAKNFGLNIRGAVSLSGRAQAIFSGEYKGRQVEMKIQEISKGHHRLDYGLSITIPCTNPHRMRLQVLPVLSSFDIYLGPLPPKLTGPWPCSDSFEVRGEPETTVRSLMNRVGADHWRMDEAAQKSQQSHRCYKSWHGHGSVRKRIVKIPHPALGWKFFAAITD